MGRRALDQSQDIAPIRLLILRQGKWEGKQLFPTNWIRMATTPTTIGQDYGYLWWLDAQGERWTDLPRPVSPRWAPVQTPSGSIPNTTWWWFGAGTADGRANELFKKIWRR